MEFQNGLGGKGHGQLVPALIHAEIRRRWPPETGFIPNHPSGICLPEFVVNAQKSEVDVQDNLGGKSWKQIRLEKLKQILSYVASKTKKQM